MFTDMVGYSALAQRNEKLLDLIMPVMDGFELLRELHKNENWRGIPVVVITANGPESAIGELKRAQNEWFRNGSSSLAFSSKH